MLSAFDLLLLTLAFITLGAGLSKQSLAWRKGQPEIEAANWVRLFKYLIGHKKILRRRASGIAHLLLFWGLVVTLSLTVMAQFSLTLPTFPAGVLSLVTDAAGDHDLKAGIELL